MFKFIQKISEKIRNAVSEKGQGMVEYALIIAVVAVIAAVVLNTSLSESISNAFSKADTQINAAAESITTENAGGNSNNGGNP